MESKIINYLLKCIRILQIEKAKLEYEYEYLLEYLDDNNKYFEFYILNNLESLVPSEVRLTRISQISFFGLFAYLTVSILYYFGTIEEINEKIQFNPSHYTPWFLIAFPRVCEWWKSKQL